MALVVEDGTALANAESYISVVAATTYHADRGNAAWAALASDTVREQLLRQATEYMGQVYRRRWASFRMKVTQALDWPRAWVPLIDAPGPYGSWTAYVPNNVVPTEVQRACAELALLAAAGPLAPALSRLTTKEKVGEIEVDYDPNSVEFVRYRSIDMMLGPYLMGSAASTGLVRA
jgi:hypothetical protein